MNKLFTLIMMLLMFGCSSDTPITGGVDPEPELIGCEAAATYDWNAIEFETSLEGGADTWIAFSLEELTLFTVVINQAGFQCTVYNGCEGEVGLDPPLFQFETVGNGFEVGIVPDGEYWVKILNTRPNRMDFTFRIELDDIVYGCMDSNALNYDESANVDAGTCVFNDCNTEWYTNNYGSMILDCNGNCSPDSWVGDGYCDNGGYLIYPSEEAYYNVQDCYATYVEEEELVACINQYVNWIDLWCTELNWDEGDCDEIDYGCPEGQLEDCNGICAPDSWLGDGFCDDGAYQFDGVDIFFNCEEFNNDGGDCDDGLNRQQNQQPKYPNGRIPIRK